jgi:uncharacterized membrane protein
MTRWLYVALLATVAALAASLYLYGYRYDQLPERLPTHWNIRGEPDAWRAKEDVFWTFFLMPVVMAAVVALTVVLPWLSPRGFKVDGFREVYGYLMALVVLLLGYIHLAILVGSLVPGANSTRLLFGGLFLFFALMGNVLGKVRRNFWMGIRTPWTLASDAVWEGTHRLGAWLFVACGLAGFACVLAGVTLWVCLVLLVPAVVVPLVYSLVLYKRLERAGRLGPPEQGQAV